MTSYSHRNLEPSMTKLQSFFVTEIVRKNDRERGPQFFKREDIRKNSADEKVFNRDVIAAVWFCRIFSVLFLQKHRAMVHPYIW